MKQVAAALYNRPVVFLAVVQAVATAAAAAHVVSGWIPLVTLGAVTALQRSMVSPVRRRKR